MSDSNSSNLDQLKAITETLKKIQLNIVEHGFSDDDLLKTHEKLQQVNNQLNEANQLERPLSHFNFLR